MNRKDLKFAVLFIIIIAAVAIGALVYAQQTSQVAQPSASSQPTATPTPSQSSEASPTPAAETSPTPQTSQTPQPSTSPGTSATPSSSATPAPSSSPGPSDLTQAQIRDAVMTYISVNHNETDSYLPNNAWTGGLVEGDALGLTTYSYQSGNWNVTMTYPVVPNALYTITVECDSSGSSLQQPTITWKGTWQSGVIVEQSFKFE